MTTIIYNSAVPLEIKQSIGHLLTTVDVFCPPWLETVHIDLPEDRSDDEFCYQITAEFEYRRCRIDIGRFYIQRSYEERLEGLVHELMHVYTSPLETLIHHLLGAHDLLEDPAWDLLFTQSREMTVQDLSHLVRRLSPVE